MNVPSAARVSGGAPRTVTVLGSTGSVGRNTLDLIGRKPGRYAVEALTANVNEALLAEQARRFRPRLTAVADEIPLSGPEEGVGGYRSAHRGWARSGRRGGAAAC